MKTKQIILSDGEWKLMKLLGENAPMTLGDMVEAMQEKSCIVQRSRKSIRPIQQWRSKAQVVFMRYPLHKLFTKKCLHFIVCSVIVHIEQRK